MGTSTFRSVFLVATTAIMALALTGCPGKSDTQKNAADSPAADKGASNKSAPWEGTYQQQAADKMILSIKPEHKGTLGPAGESPVEISWEVAGDDKIIVHFLVPMTMFRTSDGNLRDQDGSTWKKK
jgi:hypothetical protein